MGYEKFVKHIFPFIGNQYREGEETEVKTRFVITLDEIISTFEQEDKMFMLDSKKGELVKAESDFEEYVKDKEKVVGLENCHLGFSFMEGAANTIDDVACLYIKDMSDIENSDVGFCRVEDLVEHQLPIEFTNLKDDESGPEFITVTTEDLELKEIKFSCPDDKTLVCEFIL